MRKIFFFVVIAALVTPSFTFAAPFPFNILASIYDQLRQRALELVGRLEEEAKEERIPFVPSQPISPPPTNAPSPALTDTPSSFPRVTVTADSSSFAFEIISNPSVYVTAIAPLGFEVSQARESGYKVMGIVGGGAACDYWPGSWEAVAEQYVKPVAKISDYVQFDEFQRWSDICKGRNDAYIEYDGQTFNMLRNVARSINPDILVGFVEPFTSQLQKIFNTGGKPDFVFGELYWGELPQYNYLRTQLLIKKGGNLKAIGMWFSDKDSEDIAKVYNNGHALQALHLTESSNWKETWDWTP